MTMGQRILRARQEAKLSQRQLAGGEITRNMLSALEHDTANPSVATLRYLSERLGKPISYFLGEDQQPVDGYDILTSARAAFDAGEYRRCTELLAEGEPGAVIAREWRLLILLSQMRLAEQAIDEDRLPYARELLKRVAAERAACPYFTDDRTLALLMARCGMETVLPDDDGALLLRAERALADGNPEGAIRYLEAADHRDVPQWHCLRGECAFDVGDYQTAADHFHHAEASYPLNERLEICYRELGDFKMAYYYAKK